MNFSANHFLGDLLFRCYLLLDPPSAGKRIDYPPTLNVTHKRAPKAKPPLPEQYVLSVPNEPPKSTEKTRR